MFDYMVWEKRILDIVSQVEQGQPIEIFHEELHQLWEQIMQEENDENALFLKTILSNMRKLINGQLDTADLEHIVKEMRSDFLEDVQ